MNNIFNDANVYQYTAGLEPGKELCDWDTIMYLLNETLYPNSSVNRDGVRDTDRNGKRPWGIFFKEDEQHFGIWSGKSLNPYIYRGENKHYDDFIPSIQRGNYINYPYDKCVDVIKKYEFIRIFKQSPYYHFGNKIQAFNLHMKFDFEAIGQHYSFPTNYIDITRRKSIAYFFAYTYYRNGKYYPITDFTNYEPVLYIADIRTINNENPDILKKITFQVLKRPTIQYAMGEECKFKTLFSNSAIAKKSDICFANL